jgi:hypothetical protein
VTVTEEQVASLGAGEPEPVLARLVRQPWLLAGAALGAVLVGAAYLSLYYEYETIGQLGNQQPQYAFETAGSFLIGLTLFGGLWFAVTRGAIRLASWAYGLLALGTLGWVLTGFAQLGTLTGLSASGGFAASTYDHVMATAANGCLAVALLLGAVATARSGHGTRERVGRGAVALGLGSLAVGNTVACVTAAGPSYAGSVHEIYTTAATTAFTGVLWWFATRTAPTSARLTASIALVVIGGGWWAVGRALATLNFGQVAVGGEIVGAGYLVLASALVQLLIGVSEPVPAPMDEAA